MQTRVVKGFEGPCWVWSFSFGEKRANRQPQSDLSRIRRAAGPRHCSRFGLIFGASICSCVNRVKMVFTKHGGRNLQMQLPGFTVFFLSQAVILAAGSTKVVMVTGDHAPDTNGVFASIGLTVGGLNDAG